LHEEARDIEKMMVDFIISYSNIVERWAKSDADFVFIGADYKWKELSPEGKQLQSKLLKKYSKFAQLISLLVSDLPNNTKKQVEEATEQVRATIEQSKTLWLESKEKELNNARAALTEHIKALEGVYDPQPNSNILVPDTNALLINPDMEKWSVGEMDSFTLVLMPVVLSELDKLKSEGKTEVLRDKAKSLTKRIKEYIRRGDISEGVKLSGKRMVKTIAIEADFSKTLPWLDPNNNDDRLLAFYFESVKQFPRSNVILVTDDVNLQNKAANANALYIDPPEKE
jgi:hypothetical protein